MRASIIIPTYNEGSRLWKTVESVSQSSGAINPEIIVVDDSSWDNSIAQLRDRFPRVKVIRNEEQLGASPSKDIGVSQSRGNVLVFLDSHCRPADNSIERLVLDIEELNG